jgi:hypothetical protein
MIIEKLISWALIIAALQARLGIEAGRWTGKDMAGVAARSRARRPRQSPPDGPSKPSPAHDEYKAKASQASTGGHEQINLIRERRGQARYRKMTIL